MITIKIRNLLTPEAFEKLEDELGKFLENKGLCGVIDNEVTGNTVCFARC